MNPVTRALFHTPQPPLWVWGNWRSCGLLHFTPLEKKFSVQKLKGWFFLVLEVSDVKSSKQTGLCWPELGRTPEAFSAVRIHSPRWNSVRHTGTAVECTPWGGLALFAVPLHLSLPHFPHEKMGEQKEESRLPNGSSREGKKSPDETQQR